MSVKTLSDKANLYKIVAFLILVAAALALATCGKEPTDEEKIEALIRDAAEKAEAKDIRGVLKHVSESYKDREGNDRNQIKGLLFVYFQGYEKIGIFIRDIKVEVKGDDAMAVVKLVFTGGAEIIPESGSGYVLDLKLKREEGDWRVVRAGWTESKVLF
ncbi:MAG: hypothetical protein JW984_13535 [Deltaproteobacteria bacterium]|uniref:Nuclear transport factor 2 family protein n=1 Tax=Candidatus Zymogenus saltonus TaxID=2844893 RepID=A0A9D8KHH4_9DELT|nr:hypothetical protein [Candidatus Zymogenus saltonus]